MLLHTSRWRAVILPIAVGHFTAGRRYLLNLISQVTAKQPLLSDVRTGSTKMTGNCRSGECRRSAQTDLCIWSVLLIVGNIYSISNL